MKVDIRLQYEIAGRIQDVAFFDTAHIKGEHPRIKNIFVVELPPLKTTAERTVYISKETYGMIKM